MPLYIAYIANIVFPLTPAAMTARPRGDGTPSTFSALFAYLRLLGPIWEPFGRHFDTFWHHLGPMSVLLGSFFGFLAPFGPHVGAFGPLFSIFGAVWAPCFKLRVDFALHVCFLLFFC